MYMKLSNLLLYIVLAIIGFWLLSFAVKLAGWVIEIVLVVGLVLVIISLVSQYFDSQKTKAGKTRKKVKSS